MLLLGRRRSALDRCRLMLRRSMWAMVARVLLKYQSTVLLMDYLDDSGVIMASMLMVRVIIVARLRRAAGMAMLGRVME